MRDSRERAPADLRKEGNHLDLAIALALLAGTEQLPRECLEGRRPRGGPPVVA